MYMMRYQLLLLVASMVSILNAIEEVYVDTPGGQQLLNGFAVYDQFLSYNEKLITEKSRAATSFIVQYSKIPFAELFSNMGTNEFIIIEILHALYSEEVYLSTFYTELAQFVQKNEDNDEGNYWITRNIKFSKEVSFKIIKSLVAMESKTTMHIPPNIFKEILLITDIAGVLKTAVEIEDIRVVKWILDTDVQFNRLETLVDTAFSKNRTDIAKLLIGKGAIDNVSQNRRLIDMVGPKQETLLHLAAQSHRPPAVSALLKGGLSPDAEDEDGYTALHRATEAQDEEAVGLLLEGGANVNHKTPSGDLPLHIAVSKGNLGITKLLVKHGSSMDTKNNLGLAPLYLAENTVVAAVLGFIEDFNREKRMNALKTCQKNSYRRDKCQDERKTSTLNSLFLEGFDEFLENSYSSKIMCHNKDLKSVVSLSEIVNYFLRKGEIFRLPPHLKLLLSIKAQAIKNEELSEIMVNLGYSKPDINIEPLIDSIEDLYAEFMSFEDNVKFKNATGHTNLHVSAFNGDLKAVKSLISNGADIQALTNSSWTPLHFAASKGYISVIEFLLKNNASVNAKTWKQETPLHLAASNNYAEAVKMLLENGANVNAVMNPDCMSALYVASRDGNLGVVEALVEANASVNYKNCGSSNLTPFQIAALYDRFSVVRYLALHGADIDVRNSEGVTPLYNAAWYGKEEMVQTLIESGANLMLGIGKEGYTALHAAAWRGHADIVKLLLQAGVDPDVRDRSLLTPLHLASSLGVAKELIHQGASVNARSNRGITPLHVASSLGHADIVKELLQSGAMIDAKTIDGRTPAYEAISNNQYLSLKILLENGTNLNEKGPNGLTVLNFGLIKGMLKLNNS